ncbi:signal-transducing adaptor protein 1 [Myripristis murdjan]|uniref:Signal transducing adaptor family member 2b n=1 Tax=Myripristis murdjan TaxID=586833 RepID=A0A667XA79_9TELE|nr:signal-transducing adaptor protein 2 [Myripristis murdjan]
MAARPGRKRTELSHCYYEGFLEKRSFKDKASRKLWTCLCGNTLFFFNSNKDSNYIEKLDLSGFISITDDNSWDHKVGVARLSLRLKDGEFNFTAPTAEARELWKAYIHSVAELSVPSSCNLLPGQIHVLKETIKREGTRRQTLSPPADSSLYVTLKPDMPACYYPVSRIEAEVMLEKYADKGNLLLRPGSTGNSFAVTTRQDLNGPIVRHYLVNRKHDGGFTIDVENPIPCATLHDVINYLVEKTSGTLIPLIMENAYDSNILFIHSNEENGEKSVQCALSNPVLSQTLPPKPAPRKLIPFSKAEPEPDTGECLYMNEDALQDIMKEEAERLSSCTDLPKPDKPSLRQALMPPTRTAAPRSFPASSSTTDNPSGKTRAYSLPSVQPDHRVQSISEELKVKFEKIRKLQE